MNPDVNFVAVLLAAVASMILGFLWYSQSMFGRKWMALMGYTEKDLKKEQQSMGPLYGLSFLGALVMAYVLSHVSSLSSAYFGNSFSSAALSSAFWMWLGFVATVQMTDTIFGSKKWGLYKINTLYQLASLLVMALVLGYFA